MNSQTHIIESADGVPIHYDVQGSGTPALVFVHGWCCDRHYWDRQVEHFASDYTVVSLDLAGHGASGRGRARWTIESFGGDVAAVAEQLGLDQVVLIGHSLGGAVIIEAARRMHDTVLGLVGADTWKHVENALSPAQASEMVAPFRADFAQATRALVLTMFVPASDAVLVERIATAMSAMPPQIGVGVAEQASAYNHRLKERLQEVQVPKIAINSADWVPTDKEAVQRCGVKVVLMSGVGHFVMIEGPQTFNRLLGEAIQDLISSSVAQ